ncbi:hypothetical protein PoB_000741600 [Plakobranchus ocellatus]|uniref:Uncharacterized protein n=1 Tax=Plakobranchus ocellatus TaxID=259542 RepID=A0AAV3YCJ2_9GAST|nr:hypothetical protein PoB_000741600 [Plakobranchus ocellatus]
MTRYARERNPLARKSSCHEYGSQNHADVPSDSHAVNGRPGFGIYLRIRAAPSSSKSKATSIELRSYFLFKIWEFDLRIVFVFFFSGNGQKVDSKIVSFFPDYVIDVKNTECAV